MREDSPTPVDSSPLIHLREEAQDRRILRSATLVAVLVHACLFALTFPESIRDVAEARSPRVFVVRPVRFKPPADTRRTPLIKRSQRVPIPDPTPADPEPLFAPESETPEMDFSVSLAGIDSLVPPPPPIDMGPVEYRLEMKRPVRISGADPRYTEIARRARLEGLVVLRAVIGHDGAVRDLRVVRPLGLGLEEAAVAAVQNWRFEPARLDGKPVDVIYSVTVRFSLR